MTKRRAILSVYDKTHLPELGRGLVALGFEILASGGTARCLREADIPVDDIQDITAFPEILGGRVKTLHPAVHGGILARDRAEDRAELERHGIQPVALVVCNLYPFQKRVDDAQSTREAIIEEIDIGGVTLLRAAAKNHASVMVVVDPKDYERVLAALEEGQQTSELQRELAAKAFSLTAEYDGAIARWMAADLKKEHALGDILHLTAKAVMPLRYGENPHQQASLYALNGQELPFEQVQGKMLSYNNLIDLDAAWAIPGAFEAPCVAIIKHTNPCGLAVGETLVEAFEKARASDPISAFGSIIAVNRPIDETFARALGRLFVEVLVAPAFSQGALDHLATHKKRCRVMIAHAQPHKTPEIRAFANGLLVQERDQLPIDPQSWKVAGRIEPSPQLRDELAFAWAAVKFVKSNAIVFTRDGATVGVGAGQMNRVQSVRLAANQAQDKAQGAVMASDAFFPFPDGIEVAAEAGIQACIQPGGSIRDAAVIEAADRLGMAMIFTGHRHFKH